jgi:G3E family GTPase
MTGSSPRFIMIGGFLGAGKTTTVARLARHYQEAGLRVGIVTNDQASDLVDTSLLRSQGFEVGEVAGSCFCCNFNELAGNVDRLEQLSRAEVIIAEPVGSCTDLVATVIRPMQQIHARPFTIAPYGVILKPGHGAKILGKVAQGGFSPQAEYIFRKQIEEADFVVLNRIDELELTEIDRLQGLVESQYPGRPVIRMSARTGEGFDQLREMLDSGLRAGRRVMEVDYDVYAEGEAELGWLNSQLTASSDTMFRLDAFLLDLLATLQRNLAGSGAETAHIKLIGMADGAYAVANLISNDSPPVLSLASQYETRFAEVVLNARVAIDPDLLVQEVRAALDNAAKTFGIKIEIRTIQSFRPGRPEPTHRLSTASDS